MLNEEDVLDKELYDNYIQGNEKAFEELYLKYKNRIFYFIFNMIKDIQKAEDITQDVFLYIATNKHYNTEYSFKSYIYLVAKSKTINFINKENRRNQIDDMIIKEEQLIEDVEEIIFKKEEERILLKAIKLLKDDYKKIIYLIDFEKLPYKEVAKIMNKSESNVKVSAHRAKKQLKGELEKEDYNEYYRNSKQPMNIMKVVLMLVLILFLSIGVAYATITIIGIVNSKEKGEPIKWDSSKITSTASITEVQQHMKYLDDNTYMIDITSMEELETAESNLKIEFEDKELFNKDIFGELEYDLILLLRTDKKKIELDNVIPYEEIMSIELKEGEAFSEEINGFCIWVPQTYKRNIVEIKYKELGIPEEPSEDALLFKFSEFTVNDYTNEFLNTLEYEEENDIYKLVIGSKDDFNNLAQKLDIDLKNNIEIDTLDNKEMFFVFKKNVSSKLSFRKIMRSEDNIINLTLGEGKNSDNVMAGFLLIVDKNAGKGYKIIVNENVE